MTDMRTAFAEEASALLDEDPLAAVVLAEISADLFAKAAARHPDRVLNVGIREQLMVSVGGGLALAGMRPIVHSYAPFLVERAFEQVKLDLGAPGRARRAGQHRGVVRRGPGRADAPGAGGRGAAGHACPGSRCVVPGHPAEVRGLLRGAVGALDAGSAYLRLSTESNREARPVWPGLQVVQSGPAGGGGRGGADARPGARRGGRPGRDRGVHDHGPAVRRRGAAVAGGCVGGRGAGRAVPGRDVRVRGVFGAGFAAAPAAEPGSASAPSCGGTGRPPTCRAAGARRGRDPALGDQVPRFDLESGWSRAARWPRRPGWRAGIC